MYMIIIYIIIMIVIWMTMPSNVVYHSDKRQRCSGRGRAREQAHLDCSRRQSPPPSVSQSCRGASLEPSTWSPGILNTIADHLLLLLQDTQ